MENNPCVILQYDGGEFEARPDNSHLYTFMGRLALYNHVFCFDVQDGEVQQSFYIFQSVDTDGYNELEKYMIDNYYPAHLNLREVSGNDASAHERATFKALERQWGSDNNQTNEN